MTGSLCRPSRPPPAPAIDITSPVQTGDVLADVVRVRATGVSPDPSFHDTRNRLTRERSVWQFYWDLVSTSSHHALWAAQLQSMDAERRKIEADRKVNAARIGAGVKMKKRKKR